MEQIRTAASVRSDGEIIKIERPAGTGTVPVRGTGYVYKIAEIDSGKIQVAGEGGFCHLYLFA